MPCDVKLIANTAEPSKVVAAAAKLCYSASSAGRLYEGLDADKTRHFLGVLRDMGHLSPFEHASFTFAVEGVSRVATHQLVRHRVASYSQRSQRYVAMESRRCVIPPEIMENGDALGIFEESVNSAYEAYEKMVSMGVPKEDARFILPHGWETSIMVTMNARELHHFFELRLCRRAQWEIRGIARRMFALVREIAPELFEIAGPPCVSAGCREHDPCGRPFSCVEEVLSEK